MGDAGAGQGKIDVFSLSLLPDLQTERLSRLEQEGEGRRKGAALVQRGMQVRGSEGQGVDSLQFRTFSPSFLPRNKRERQ